MNIGSYVIITKKILDTFPSWKNIVNKYGIVVEIYGNSARVHILSDCKKELNIIYSFPIDSLKEISEERFYAELL